MLRTGIKYCLPENRKIQVLNPVIRLREGIFSVVEGCRTHLVAWFPAIDPFYDPTLINVTYGLWAEPVRNGEMYR